MARPRNYDRAQVVRAAKEAFWNGGYSATGIEELEEATGLGRSSLYLAFGSKHKLFEAALDEYEDSFITPMLGGVEATGANLQDIAAFFHSLEEFFKDPATQRGCLMMNSIAELSKLDPYMAAAGAAFINRYRLAFRNALQSGIARGQMDRTSIKYRVSLLTASVSGIWLIVRIDRIAAMADSRTVAREVLTWAQGESDGPTRPGPPRSRRRTPDP